MLSSYPCTVRAASRFVADHHRHNRPPRGGLFATAVAVGDDIVGVAIVGRPTGRGLQDGFTVEVTRVCTLGTPNACSMLYGAATRGAEALGWRRAITYTLDDDTESGASLRASGWTLDAHLAARPTWDTPSRPREQTDLFGDDKRPPGPKVRWVKMLRPRGINPDS